MLAKHLHYHYNWLRSEIVEIYINLAIRSLAISMAGIFIPIYLLTLGYSLNIIFWYCIATYFMFGISSLFVAVVSKKLGLKHIIMLSIPFYITFFIMLYFLNGINYKLLFSIGIIEGFASAFYWVPLHSLFARYSKKNKIGQQAGYIYSLPGMVSIIGPVIGGALILAYSFKILLIVIICLMVLSLVPLFFTKDIKKNESFSFKDFKNENMKKYFSGFAVQGFISVAAGIVWPLFVFMIVKNTLSLGISGSFVTLSTVIFPIILGKMSKKTNLMKIFKIGVMMSFVLFLLIPFVNSNIEAYVASLFIGFIVILVELPFYTFAVKNAAQEKPLEFMIFREVALTTGRIGILLLLIILGNSFTAGFVMASAVSLLALII